MIIKIKTIVHVLCHVSVIGHGLSIHEFIVIKSLIYLIDSKVDVPTFHFSIFTTILRNKGLTVHYIRLSSQYYNHMFIFTNEIPLLCHYLWQIMMDWENIIFYADQYHRIQYSSLLHLSSSSSSSDLRHDLFGLPLFRLPWGSSSKPIKVSGVTWNVRSVLTFPMFDFAFSYSCFGTHQWIWSYVLPAHLQVESITSRSCSWYQLNFNISLSILKILP